MDKNPLVYEYSIGKRKPYDYDYGFRPQMPAHPQRRAGRPAAGTGNGARLY